MKEFDEMIQVMSRLRKECPWDKEQDLLSLRKFMLEEAYECVAAINEGPSGYEHLIEELGDVLLQVLFQSELLSEKFNKPIIREVVETLKSKMIRRHPHVFGDSKANTSETVLKQWDQIKKEEKGEVSDQIFPKVKSGLTALQTSQEIGKASKKVAFDWDHPNQVWDQVKSEEAELLAAKTSDETESEYGDLLFSLVQWARHKNIDAETALVRANQKFLSRFKTMEDLIGNEKLNYEKLNLEEKETLWNRAKEIEIQKKK